MGEKIPSDVRGNIESALNELKEVLKDENATKETISSKVETLSKMAEDMYKAAANNEQNANKAQGDNKKADDVIDAEVE